MTDQKIMMECDTCSKKFQFGPHQYEGRDYQSLWHHRVRHLLDWKLGWLGSTFRTNNPKALSGKKSTRASKKQ